MPARSEPLLWVQLIGAGAFPLEGLLLLLLLAGSDPGPVPALERLLVWGLGCLAPTLLLWRRPADVWSLLLLQTPLRARRPLQQRLSRLQDTLGLRLSLAFAAVISLPLLWWLDEHAAVASWLSPLQGSPRLVVLLLAALLLALMLWQWQQLLQALWLLTRSPEAIAAVRPMPQAELEQQRLCLGLPLLLLDPLQLAEAPAAAFSGSAAIPEPRRPESPSASTTAAAGPPPAAVSAGQQPSPQATATSTSPAAAAQVAPLAELAAPPAEPDASPAEPASQQLEQVVQVGVESADDAPETPLQVGVQAEPSEPATTVPAAVAPAAVQPDQNGAQEAIDAAAESAAGAQSPSDRIPAAEGAWQDSGDGDIAEPEGETALQAVPEFDLTLAGVGVAPDPEDPIQSFSPGGDAAPDRLIPQQPDPQGAPASAGLVGPEPAGQQPMPELPEPGALPDAATLPEPAVGAASEPDELPARQAGLPAAESGSGPDPDGAEAETAAGKAGPEAVDVASAEVADVAAADSDGPDDQPG